MEAPLEIRYAGVVIGRAQDMRSAEADALSFFIPVRDPMPVGTVLRMRSGDLETPVRVVRAVESADGAVSGMQVKTIGEAEEVALEFIPPPAVAGEKLKAAPVVEIDLARLRAESAAAEVAAPARFPVTITIAAPAPVRAPEVKAAEAAPVVRASGSSGEVAAVPEAVPVTVGSSMTGALRNATESVPISMPAPQAPTVPVVQASEPASPKSDTRSESASTRELTQEYGSVAVTEAETESADVAMATGQPSSEDLPPARPISGPSGRRKTKRRR